MVNISGLSKAQVLAALVNSSKLQGNSWLDPKANKTMSVSDAQEIIDSRQDYLYFDYVWGRVIKCDLTGEEFSESLYDRDIGPGSAQKVIAALRAAL